MKKKTAFLISCILLLTVFLALALTACDDVNSKEYFSQENLALSAKATGSEFSRDATALIDASQANAFSATMRYKRFYADIDFGKEVEFNTVVLKENTDNVKKFRLYVWTDNSWEMVYEQDRIMGYRVCYIEPVKTQKLRFEVVDSLDKVSMKSLEVYNVEKKDTEFRVYDYMRMDYDKESGKNQMVALSEQEGFYGYFTSITDVIIFDTVNMDDEGNLVFYNGEEQFEEGFAALKKAIEKSGNNVNIWATVLFDKNDASGKRDNNLTSEFLKNKRENINASIKAFVEKYGLYGIDYDWEFPQKGEHWKNYDNLVIDTAAYTKVSVAVPGGGIQFSHKAKEATHHINVMLYDMFDERGDHSNFYDTMIKAMKNVEKGYTKSQLAPGIPTYARSTNNSPDSWPEYGQCPELGKWSNVIRDFPYTEKDEQGNTITLRCDAYLNSYALVRDKTAAAIAMGYGGIMVFRMKCDAPFTYEYSLHRAILEVLQNRLA